MHTHTATDARTFPFFQVENALIDRFGAVIGPYGIAVYACIARHVNQKTGVAWPSLATIARETGMSRRQASQSVKRLKELGLLKVRLRVRDDGGLASNEYILVNIEPGSADVQDTSAESPDGAQNHTPVHVVHYPYSTTCTGVVHHVPYPSAPRAHKQYESNNTNLTRLSDAKASEPLCATAQSAGGTEADIEEPIPAQEKDRRKSRKRDQLFDLVAEQLFCVPPGGAEVKNIAGRVGKVKKALAALNANADEFLAACQYWRKEKQISLPRDAEKVSTMILEYRQRRRHTGVLYADGSTYDDVRTRAAEVLATMQAADTAALREFEHILTGGEGGNG